MNSEINLRMDFIIKEIMDNNLDETLSLKIRAISGLMRAETSRVEQGGEPDEKATKTFARILDRFSAQLLELGLPENECEWLNDLANDIRKSAHKRPE
jgi:hypothetical protein